jgi:hypothetical protein
MLWVDVAQIAAESGGFLRFGGKPLDLVTLRRMLDRAHEETLEELGGKLEILIGLGLLAREADGAISCPMLTQALMRSEINRVNGSKGGRPRKDGQPQASRSRLEVIEGGAALPMKQTGSGPKEEAMAKRTEPATVQPLAGDDLDREWRRIVPLAARWAGFSTRPGPRQWNESVVRGWLEAGADEALIKEVIREKTSNRVYSFAYFDNAIKAALATRQLPRKPLWEREWEKDYSLWELTRIGSCPRSADYKAKYGDGEAA